MLGEYWFLLVKLLICWVNLILLSGIIMSCDGYNFEKLKFLRYIIVNCLVSLKNWYKKLVIEVIKYV